MNRIWVAIAHDNQTFRSSFVQLLNRSNEIIVVAEAESGQSGIDLVTQHRPDVLLMGSSVAGVEATKVITTKFPETKVIILSMRDSPEHWEKALNAGAAGVITKDTSPSEMVQAIRTAVPTA